ncbi:MAG: hypothetical protein AAGG81_02005 [Chlamydiota bacterium]
MNYNNLFKKFFLVIFSVIMTISCLIPANKIEARGEGAVIAAAGLGAIVGAAVASDVHHKHHRKQACAARNFMVRQQQTMNYVLMNYNPAFHDAWVRYIIVDCGYILTPIQQSQLIDAINQRRAELGHHVPVGAGRCKYCY